jgi:hypothetical protein
MFILPVSAISNEDVVDQTTEFYINDYADIVSPEVEEEKYNKHALVLMDTEGNFIKRVIKCKNLLHAIKRSI